jgi:hypothetical protein
MPATIRTRMRNAAASVIGVPADASQIYRT